MKSTPEERAAKKIKRRTKNIRRHVADLDWKCRRSKRSLEVCLKALKSDKVAEYMAHYHDSIRMAS